MWYHCYNGRDAFCVNDFDRLDSSTRPEGTSRNFEKIWMWWAIARDTCKCVLQGIHPYPKIKVDFHNFHGSIGILHNLEKNLVEFTIQWEKFVTLTFRALRIWLMVFDCFTHRDLAIWPLGSCSRPHLTAANDEVTETPWNSGDCQR